MLIQEERLTPLVAENARRLFENHPTIRQFIHRRYARIGRADLQQRLGPQPRFVHEFAVDEFPRAFVSDGEERANEITIVAEDVGVEVKDAHGCRSCSS